MIDVIDDVGDLKLGELVVAGHGLVVGTAIDSDGVVLADTDDAGHPQRRLFSTWS